MSRQIEKSALIIGITGGFGGHVARALARRGWRLRALLRDPSRLPADLQGVDAMQGDAADPEQVERAMDGMGTLVHGANVPYPRWRAEAMPMLEVAAAAAARRGARLLFPGNVYNYDPADGPTLDEASPQHPPTEKGRIRVEMERRLRRAANNGAEVVILRCGDFFGADAPSTWMNEVVKPARGDRWKLTLPGPADVPHAWAYLPDVGEAAARLLSRPAAPGTFEVFHFRGHQASLERVGESLASLVGEDNVRRGSLPWGALALAAPFWPMARELRELRYLWDEPLELDGGRLEAAVGPLPHTPLPEALAATFGPSMG